MLYIQMRHEGDQWNMVPNNSTVLNLIVLQEIAMELSRKQHITLDRFKANHPGGHIGEMLRKDDLNGERLDIIFACAYMDFGFGWDNFKA